MGFYIMVFSGIIGLYLIFLGISRRTRNIIYIILLLIGIVMLSLSFYLALPH